MSALFTALVEGETKESLAEMVCELREERRNRIYAARWAHHLVVKHMQAGDAAAALAAMSDDGDLHQAIHRALVGECDPDWHWKQVQIDVEMTLRLAAQEAESGTAHAEPEGSA